MSESRRIDESEISVLRREKRHVTFGDRRTKSVCQYKAMYEQFTRSTVARSTVRVASSSTKPTNVEATIELVSERQRLEK